jgi:hypothetical protein
MDKESLDARDGTFIVTSATKFLLTRAVERHWSPLRPAPLFPFVGLCGVPLSVRSPLTFSAAITLSAFRFRPIEPKSAGRLVENL